MPGGGRQRAGGFALRRRFGLSLHPALTLVSVLLPARNAAATLDEAVESIRAQTHAQWELLAVNDASQDETRALLERWARRDGRIQVMDSCSSASEKAEPR